MNEKEKDVTEVLEELGVHIDGGPSMTYEEYLEKTEGVKIVPKDKILFAKLREDAIIPSKEEENAGYDFYACFEGDSIIIMPHKTGIIPTGIAFAVNSDYYLQFEERGSTGLKGMKRSAGVNDSGYRDELMFELYNGNDIPIIIAKEPFYNGLSEILGLLNEPIAIVHPYSKAIVQGVFHILPKLNTEEVSYEELLTYNSQRGIGKLGSSGK